MMTRRSFLALFGGLASGAVLILTGYFMGSVAPMPPITLRLQVPDAISRPLIQVGDNASVIGGIPIGDHAAEGAVLMNGLVIEDGEFKRGTIPPRCRDLTKQQIKDGAGCWDWKDAPKTQ